MRENKKLWKKQKIHMGETGEVHYTLWVWMCLLIFDKGLYSFSKSRDFVFAKRKNRKYRDGIYS